MKAETCFEEIKSTRYIVENVKAFYYLYRKNRLKHDTEKRTTKFKIQSMYLIDTKYVLNRYKVCTQYTEKELLKSVLLFSGSLFFKLINP